MCADVHPLDHRNDVTYAQRMRVDGLPQLGAVPIVGILRGCPPDRAADVAAAAADAGLTVIEVTLDSERALDQIAAVVAACPGLVVGAGTALRPEQVDAAQGCGAAFVVAPVTDAAVIERCVQAGLPCLPGASTPSEAWTARRLGAAAVKLFPAAELGGPAYLRAIAVPLAGIPFVPTGGVDASNARAYLDAGAAALGVGASIFPADALRAGDVERVRTLTAQAVAAATAG
jgi:2-dehydro-3-deoxyphosphogluconate aldolase/(4S)-4-hydroxy-2-oxoglutarate aldolase